MTPFDLARYAAAALLVWYALGDTPAGTYTGSMAGLHDASRSMAADDRQSLAEAMTAGGDMLAADTRGLVNTTEKAQEFVAGILEFSYNGIGKPKTKYPAVADAISAEMQKAVGDKVGPFDAAGRARLVDSLLEAGRALR